ncbi:putative receptor-type tyrosine-protein phosphatase mosPTP-1 [Chironomus tepperi]|uniref:putative receptor-type tyrosine-protein phosphatase mosPTP-1 n=2 Tax=Chironomus tepperi TaxID=113505 RepID=UPI00391F39B8
MNFLAKIHFGLLLFGLFSRAARIFDEENIPMKQISVTAGYNLTLPCPGVNEHSLIDTLVWKKSQQTILKFVNGLPMVHNQKISLLTDNYSLYFNKTVSTDTGEYSCIINDRHSPESIIDLLIQDVPAPPERPLITYFTSRQVNLSWAHLQDSRNDPVIDFIIQIRFGENGAWDECPEVHTNSSEASYVVRGLKPFTVYSFRILAVNKLGVSLPSKESYYICTLREAPVGKPTTTVAHNTSSTSVRISWKPPTLDTIHGEFLGYRITYRARDKQPEDIKEIYIRDSSVESHEITNLETFTQYLVSVQVFNPEGPGPASTVLIMTDEGVPSKPQNVRVLDITSTTIKISWYEPERPNGVIHAYRVYYVFLNQTLLHLPMLKNDASVGSPFHYTLINLKPYTEYKIIVIAFTLKYDGEPSDPVIQRTDIAGPSAPQIINLTCHSQDAIFLQWRRPTSFYNSIDFYVINYKENSYSNYQQIQLNTSSSYPETAIIIQNLTTYNVYTVNVQAASSSIINPRRILLGSHSASRKITLQPNCETIQPLLRQSTSEYDIPILAAIVGSFGFIFFVLLIILWRKCCSTSNYREPSSPQQTNQPQTVIINWEANGVEKNETIHTNGGLNGYNHSKNV